MLTYWNQNKKRKENTDNLKNDIPKLDMNKREFKRVPFA